MCDLTHARLKELLDYDPLTGLFTWCVCRAPQRPVGSVAGTLCQGYVRIRLDRAFYAAHRLAFFYVHGRWPVGLLDHRNRVRNDNRIENLREVTPSENILNVVEPSKNNHGRVRGVHPRGRKFVAKLTVSGKQQYLGAFKTQEDASAAYHVAKQAHVRGGVQ